MLKIKECPHCKSKEGYYQKMSYSGSGIFRFNYDGSIAENSDMYDCLFSKKSKYYYCLNCNKKIAKARDDSNVKD